MVLIVNDELRLKEIDDLVDILYADKVEIREFVRQSLKKDDTVDSMAHVIKVKNHLIKVKNKERRELSDFLKKRSIPLKKLSPLITVMHHVQELEKNLEHGAKVVVKTAEKLLEEQEKTQRYRKLINEIYFQTSLVETSDNVHDAVMEAIKALEESECRELALKNMNIKLP